METDSPPTAEEQPELRWYQFRLRSLFILTILVAIASSWFAVEVRRASKQKDVVATLMKAGGTVWYDYHQRVMPGAASRSAWPRSVLGDDFGRDVLGITFYASKVTDADLKHLKGLKHLLWLHLCSTKITDAGLENLEEMRQLDVLDLSDTLVTDAGLERLREKFPRLRVLELGRTQVTDAGLEHLEGMQQIEYLRLWKTKVTDAGVEKLKKALPNCSVHR